MNEYLPGMESERRMASLSQWYSPPQLAAHIVEWALQPCGEHELLTVLEPSCGQGALIHAMLDTIKVGFVLGVDIDPRNVAHCRKRFEPFGMVGIDEADFLKYWPERRYDLAIMNSPFEDGQTEEHALHALKHCDRVVFHGPLSTLAGQKRRAGIWSQVSLPRLDICSTRPSYGDGGGKTEMATFEIVPELQDGVRTHITWWP